MWCGKCGVSHPQSEPCKYPEVSKSLYCSTCGDQQNDHIKGCPVKKELPYYKSVRDVKGKVILKRIVLQLGFPATNME